MYTTKDRPKAVCAFSLDVSALFIGLGTMRFGSMIKSRREVVTRKRQRTVSMGTTEQPQRAQWLEVQCRNQCEVKYEPATE